MPPVLLMIWPPEPLPPVEEKEPPADTLMPPLDDAEPAVPTAAVPPVLDPVPACAAVEPPVPTGLLPPLEPGSSGVVPPELQAIKQSKEATLKSWGPGLDQE